VITQEELQTYIQEVIRSNRGGIPDVLSEVIREFAQSLQKKCRNVNSIGHDLSSSFLFIIHISPYRSALYCLAVDSAVKDKKRKNLDHALYNISCYKVASI
jgi:regulator of PEP synthase PpsR (kinase-PPPase family)